MATLIFSRRNRALVWLPLAAMLAAACGGGDGESGVGVKNIDADIAFGLEPPVEGITKVTDVAPPPPDPDFGDDEVVLEPTGPRTRRTLRPRRKDPSTCPAARANSSAALAAGQEVLDLPQEGSYRWKKGGTIRRNEVDAAPIPLTGFEQRLITDVVEVSRGTNPADGKPNITFTYKVIAPYDTDKTETRHYTVKTNVEGQREVNARTGQRARTGAPDRGLSLTRVTITDKRGEVQSDKRYSPPLLLLPLPVSPGETFTSSAVEAPGVGGEGGSLNFAAQVLPRQRVDACGDLIEGFEVNGSLQDAEGKVDNQRLFIATQYGAVLIYEKHDYDDAVNGRQAPEYSIGQLEPGPLPEGAG